MRWATVALLAVGCASAPVSNDSGVTADAGADGWLASSVLETDGGIVIEHVSYRSQGLIIQGEVCRPVASGKYPLLMRNHGGFVGLAADSRDGLCRNGASAGVVVASSSYRGEDGSEGPIEVCNGEVTDVQNMLAVLRTRPYVDAARVAAFGASHGGCITLQLAIREPTLKAAVDYFGPADLALQEKWWVDQLDAGEPGCPDDAGTLCRTVHQELIKIIRAGTDGGPAQAYVDRSPAFRLRDVKVPLLIFQGTADFLINTEQGCVKRAALIDGGQAPQAWFLNDKLQSLNPSVCGGNFNLTPAPGLDGGLADVSSGKHYFFMMEGQGHGFTGLQGDYSTVALVNFLFSRL